MKENELYYLAGIIDGEGNISIANATASTIQIMISNTNKRLSDWLDTKCGGFTYPVKKQKEYYKQAYCWEIRGKEAYRILKEVRDKLILKQEQADICIKVYEKITRWEFRGRMLPIWAKSLMDESRKSIKELNKTGI